MLALPTHIDATRIAPKLYQGSAPPSVDALKSNGFRHVVFCARENQPGSELMPGIEAIRCPLSDDGQPIPKTDWIAARRAAEMVLSRVADGRRVLVTCVQGRNRSGLVVALVLRDLYGWTGRKARMHVQGYRRGALTNPAFVRALDALR